MKFSAGHLETNNQVRILLQGKKEKMHTASKQLAVSTILYEGLGNGKQQAKERLRASGCLCAMKSAREREQSKTEVSRLSDHEDYYLLALVCHD